MYFCCFFEIIEINKKQKWLMGFSTRFRPFSPISTTRPTNAHTQMPTYTQVKWQIQKFLKGGLISSFLSFFREKVSPLYFTETKPALEV